ncbi:TIGR04086 family membrane protein [Aquibacillus salsiterrae]|uniref:TIGR04086 family membrane protein n=1 Tax=Aquibacillus salsiterrae TaxID=2950439 RepID=A0A9X3WAJ7_9BACI|nr:TIGR04086 family membrane protein [Aquibacillus salsiterrae]MDC3415640.1 TIGR04086 family membrane protein [Aquibacillus salsiterrae]
MAKTRMIALVYGWITVLAVMVFASLVLSLLLRFTSLGASTMTLTTLIVSIIALFAGGLVAGLKGKEKGWILGGLTGIGFTVLILLYQYLGYSGGFNLSQMLHHVGFLVAALVGGVLGVNMSSGPAEK